MRFPLLLVAVVLLVGGIAQYVETTKADLEGLSASLPLSGDMNALVTLEEGMTREDITGRIGGVLGLDETEISQLHDTYRAMQWDAFNDVLIPYLIEIYALTEADREILLTHSSAYLDREEDVLESFYTPGSYALTGEDTTVGIASKLLEPVVKGATTSVTELLDRARADELIRYIRNETELLPDLVPLPPQDVGIVDEGDRKLLVFSTIYYNQGKGNLELRADPSTIGTLGDFEREVYQRIYRENDTYRERSSGTFEWHQEHLHYHFADFIEYKLEALDGTSAVVSEGLAEKSTFCIRDISRVYIDGVTASTSAAYRICGRERQGVTVGWGDAYFSTYPDQNLDITDLPSGRYRLTFTANPEDRFDESDKSNNISSAVIEYDTDAGTVTVLETTPSELPEFEHIHIEQDL